jgi:septum formation protein
MTDLNNSGYNIILASQSPRRQMLLRELNFDFEIQVKPTDEFYPPQLKREEIALYVSKKKAEAFDPSTLGEKTLVITADTIVWLNGECIGKPENEQDAIGMLTKLSGNVHSVYTGVCLLTRERFHTFSVCTDVYFKKLSQEEIAYYVKKYQPFDKAGAYGIQEWIGYIGIERIEGSYYNVMGLPVQRLYCELKKFLEAETLT